MPLTLYRTTSEENVQILAKKAELWDTNPHNSQQNVYASMELTEKEYRKVNEKQKMNQ